MPNNPAQMQEALEKAVAKREPWALIEALMQVYGFPKSTITRVRNGDRNRNIAPDPEAGEVALKNQLYFAPRPSLGEDALFEEAERLRDDALISRHKLRFVIVTNLEQLVAYDRKVSDRLECDYADVPRYYSFFLPLAGYEKAETTNENPADIKAARKMAQLADLIRQRNALETPEQRHALYVFLARTLFCLFAEDTGIFKPHQFIDVFRQNTHRDGSDAHVFLGRLFAMLNTSPAERPANAPAHLGAFPYVNGGLFRETLTVPTFSPRARRLLLDAGTLDWSAINPDIFGSMFQAIVDPEQRGNLGQHYTSIPNILKVLRPLFLDELREDLERARGSTKRLQAFLLRLSRIKVFDPACGSGNFLVTAYKELRELELEALQALNEHGAQHDLMLSGQTIRLDHFYGIEIDDFACETSRLSLWLAEHQMNQRYREVVGEAPPTLPLEAGANIVEGNALRMDWEAVCPRRGEEEVYVCGNPPFHGYRGRSDEQNEDMAIVFEGFSSYGKMDYVASWFWKGAQYIQSTAGNLGLVTTNSIAQGIQVAMLWKPVLNLGVRIRFAYQSFLWRNSAQYNAGVTVAIIGLSYGEPSRKRLFKKLVDGWHEFSTPNISPYLLSGGNVTVSKRTSPFRADAPPMVFGSMPDDGGNLMLNKREYNELLSEAPGAERYIRRLVGSDDFLKGKYRWCLWLFDADSKDIEKIPSIEERVEKVKVKRKKGSRPHLAATPHLFSQISHPEGGQYILVPRHTSENREYAPIGFFDSNVVAHDSCLIIPNGALYEFAMLSSRMHMDWLRLVGGRLESRYRYSVQLVYNTFPWPEVTPEQRARIEELGEAIVLERENYFDWTMAEMYDPEQMPDSLRQAHRALDEAVERLYRDKPFADQAERQAYLLARYEELVRAEEAEAA